LLVTFSKLDNTQSEKHHLLSFIVFRHHKNKKPCSRCSRAQGHLDTLTVSSIAVQTSIASNPQSYHSIIFRFLLQHVKFLPFLALCYVTAINSSVILNYSRFTAPSYFSWQLNTTVRRTNKSILYVHIVGSLLEIFRWHSRALGQELPQADVMDVVLCFVQAFTNLALN